MISIRIRPQNAKTASDASTGELQDCQTENEILPKRNGAGKEINAKSKQVNQEGELSRQRNVPGTSPTLQQTLN